MSRMVPQVADKALGKKGLGYGKLVTEWAQIVGPDLAAATRPAKLTFPRGERTDATLTVEIVPARAIELQHALPQLLERVNAMFGYRAVTRIKLLQIARKPPVPIANLRPLSPTEETELMRVTALVADDDLRLALQRLGRTLGARTD